MKNKKKKRKITAPFFEIGPKNYLFGDDIFSLARYAREASDRWKVNVIFTTPYINIERVAREMPELYVFAPHMDPIKPGRGLAYVLPESIKQAGACGVMLNHTERPLDLNSLQMTLSRADELGLLTIVCADSLKEAKAVAQMGPDLMVAEPADLIGGCNAADTSYVSASVEAIRSIDPEIGILVGGGVQTGEDVYRIIYAGADATGSSSAIATARDPEAVINEMLQAVRSAWDDRHKGGSHSAL